MKRLHVSVGDLEQSIGFYSTLFAAQPIGEHSLLWGSLRRQSDCLVVVRRAKAGLAMTERVFERIV